MITTLGIGAFLLALFFITWVVIAVNSCGSCPPPIKLPNDDLCCKTFSEITLENRVANLLRENEMLRCELEYVKRSCRNHHQPPFLGCDHCCGAQVRYYAQTVDDQKIADMLAKAKNTATQLVKDLSTK